VKPRGSRFVVRLFERNTRALCKQRCVYLFRLEINILIGRSCPKQTEHHWLSSRFKTKCLKHSTPGSGLIYLPLHRDGADGGSDKWRSKGGAMFGVGDGTAVVWYSVWLQFVHANGGWGKQRWGRKVGNQKEKNGKLVTYKKIKQIKIKSLQTFVCN